MRNFELNATAVLDAGSDPLFETWVAPRIRPESRKSRFARHLLLFSVANLLSLICNGVLTFLLPRWLSIESYGYYRLFLLYAGFAGVLHFGLLDGALLRWAARSRRRLRVEMRSGLIFLLCQQASLLVPAMIVLFLWFRHQPWFFLATATLGYALLWNVATLGQCALQANKSFGLLSAITLIPPLLLLGAVLGLQLGRRLTMTALLGASLSVWLVAGIALWTILLATYPKEGRSAMHIWQLGWYNVRAGWSVLLANFLTILALSLDRFAVSLSFGIRDFAIYSLAATALAVGNTIIISVSCVVFPYLSDGVSVEQKLRAYSWGESCLAVLWALSLAGYFPLRALIFRWLPAYVLSLPILRLLMLATGLTAVIYILHANYFRSSLRQGRLLLGASVGLLAAALFLAVARRSGSLPNMAWAMVAAIALWWTVDELLLRVVIHKTIFEIGKSLFFTLACGSSFLLSASIFRNGLGVLAYSCAAALLIALVYGKTLYSLPWPDLRSLLSP